MAALDEYLWIAVCGVIFGFIMAFGIGANDVANAFASSVSAGSLTLAQAIVVASTFEFLGAVSIGASVTGTIKGKIIDAEFYEDAPELLMFGMLCSLIIAGGWLLTATYFEFPVSTTHTIVGTIIGFSLAAHGWDSVDWKEVGKLIGSWVASPVFSGFISFVFYYPVKKFVMEAGDSFDRAIHVYPLVVFVGITVNSFFVLFKMNTVKGKVDDYGHRVVLPVALGGGLIFAALTKFVIAPYLKKRVELHHEESSAEISGTEVFSSPKQDEIDDEIDVDDYISARDDFGVVKVPEGVKPQKEVEKPKDLYMDKTVLKDPVSAQRTKPTNSLHAAWDLFAENTFRQDLKTTSFHENKIAKEIWDNSAVYDSKTEFLFSYLQIFTACLTSFAHGGNDVANAIAPLSTILTIYQDGEFSSKTDVRKWVLALGGAAISLGFTFFGYRIIKAVGFKLTCITPSKGFCIELATALAVSSATYMELPVSSTQCLVGATAGAGLAAGGWKQVQWWFLGRTMSGWAFFFIVSCIFNAGFFAFCIYSPNV